MGKATVRAVVFDAYGTLFDVHAPAAEAAAELGDRGPDFSRLWRQKQLEYTWLRSLMGRYVDFSHVTADALDYAMEVFQIESPSLRSRMLDAYRTLKAYDDAAPCLNALRQAGVRTGILSNGSPQMLSAAVAAGGLGALLDYVLSVDTASIYKPSPKVYELAVNAFGVEAGEIGFVSANGWDCAGAASFGFQVVHVNRSHLPAERLGGAALSAHTANLDEAKPILLGMIS